ncbi:hypothetical protein PTKU64_77720 [Paraburkholderia terrae]|uniref:Peptidase C80 domain-containing protein n=1 Tax=Paraburkholderia terrae TaxID=311230 RepID=A0ABN6JSZ2_9BURK|nr:hypothetical protein [Paraburkholderia terrae]BCZ84097.1 hypothetical protein PTKU64_77720 [Paraburkholderia terrae]
MLAILKTPIDIAMWVKLHNLITSRKGTRNGLVAVDVFDRIDLKDMVPGEKLVLVSHGNETEFGGMTAEVLADKLIRKNLTYDTTAIKLSGCKSGSDKLGTPYCTQLALKLYDLTRHCKPPLMVNVTGLADTAVTFPDGRVRAKDPSKTPTSGPTYDEILNKYKKLEKTETVSKFDTWKNLSLSMKYGNQKEIIESAQHIATISQPMFEELYKLNEQTTASKVDSLVKAKWGMTLN